MHPFLHEITPPLFIKLLNKIHERNKKRKTSNFSPRYGPFRYVPRDVDAKWIMDIGANEGYVTKEALQSFDNSQVVCFEPVHDTYNKLEQNLSLFKDQVFLYNFAVSDYVGDCEINITTYNPANSLIPQSDFFNNYNPSIIPVKKETISVISLDSFRSELPTKFFDIVKIDVEGLELNVLMGGKIFFTECVDIVLIEISFQRDLGWENQKYLEIFNFLNSLGYRLINIYDVYNSTYEQNEIFQDMMVTQIDAVFRRKIT